MTKMVTVHLAKGVHHTRDNGEKVFYPAGHQAMPEGDAEHWYVQAHANKAAAPVLGDEAFATALRKAADAKRAEWQNVEDQALEAEQAWSEKLAAALPDGDPDENPAEEGSSGAAPKPRRRPVPPPAI